MMMKAVIQISTPVDRRLVSQKFVVQFELINLSDIVFSGKRDFGPWIQRVCNMGINHLVHNK